MAGSNHRRGLQAWLIAAALAWFAAAATAGPASIAGRPALVGIIIDDLGYRLAEGLRAVRLPGVMTVSFLPHTPYARQLARIAHANHKEIMLHLPMESEQHKALGPNGLTEDMGRSKLVQTLLDALTDIPFAVGVSNHMGSLLTADAQHMRWLMRALSKRGNLYFVDSRTTARTVAATMAERDGIPTTSRDVFLDDDRDPQAIAGQLHRLVDLARQRGVALGIGHPYPETLRLLENQLPALERSGVRLVRVSEVIGYERRPPSWQLCSSPSLKAAKSSKPSPSLICCAEPGSPL